MPYDPISPIRVQRGVLGIVPNNVDVRVLARVTVSKGDILQFDMFQADADTDSNDTDEGTNSALVAGVDVSDFVGQIYAVALGGQTANGFVECRMCGVVSANILRNSGSTDIGVGDTVVAATESSVGALDSIFAEGETYRAIMLEPMLRASEPEKHLVLFWGTNDGFGTSSDPATSDGGGSGDYSASGGGGQNS